MFVLSTPRYIIKKKYIIFYHSYLDTRRIFVYHWFIWLIGWFIFPIPFWKSIKSINFFYTGKMWHFIIKTFFAQSITWLCTMKNTLILYLMGALSVRNKNIATPALEQVIPFKNVLQFGHLCISCLDILGMAIISQTYLNLYSLTMISVLNFQNDQIELKLLWKKKNNMYTEGQQQPRHTIINHCNTTYFSYSTRARVAQWVR